MKRIAVLVVLCVFPVLLAACGAAPSSPGGAAPSASQLLSQSVAALRGQKAASFDLQLQAQASTTDPTVARYLAKPIKVDVSGGLSNSAADVTGSVSLLGKRYQLAVRADQNRTFVQFGGTWYGPGKGMTSTAQATAPTHNS